MTPTSTPRLCSRCRRPVRGRCPDCDAAWTRKPRSWAGGSTARWRSFRTAWLADNPLCTCDGSDTTGCPTCSPAQPCGQLATIVDHDDDTDYTTDRYDPAHVRSRCEPCHDRRTSQQGHEARRRS